ncbi:toxin YdaT family protein [Erwinia phyllosphaerae]|uniref:toxin YdaT family protein n=1 Tax=Erwinia phyllosphaerae TaxID=2853256 RepID=UPI001FEF0A7E|nr:toxin YdaT family protein [Erwinia phyllosphaerae]MBV4366259.1 toxin YdaT domain-containing protein [Erwinia phyllosphaerae]
MKISREAEAGRIAREIESWASEIGWKRVALSVAERRSDFRESAATARDLHNIEQQIKRALRGETDYYRRQAAEMAPALVAALPAERRVRLVDPDNPALLATVAARDGIQAINAVHLKAPASVIEQEVDRAIAALKAVKQAVLNGAAFA